MTIINLDRLTGGAPSLLVPTPAHGVHDASALPHPAVAIRFSFGISTTIQTAAATL